MNRANIIKLAQEAGFLVDEKSQQHQPNCIFHTWHMIDEGLERFAALVAAAEREILADWMIQFGFATGHGDTMEQLLDALGTEIVERIECEVETEREECAKVCEAMRPSKPEFDPRYYDACTDCAEAIKSRINT